MKQLILLAILALGTNFLKAASIVSTSSSIMPEHLKTNVFVGMSANDFEMASGKKINLFQKMYFKKLQRKLASTKYDESSTIVEHYDVKKGKFKFDPVWFIIGAIIGPFGLLFSYTSDNPTRNKHISAAIGLGVFILWFGWIFLF